MTRRVDSDMQDRIKALIEEEPDARERMRLLILLQIVTVLVDNVGAVQSVSTRIDEHSAKFDAHVEEERGLINQGRGMWRVFAIAMLLAQGALGYLYVDHIEVIKHMQEAIAANSRDIAVLRDRAGVRP